MDASCIDLSRSAGLLISKRPAKFKDSGERGSDRRGAAIVSRVRPKQYLALSVKTAFSRYVARVMPASIVERAVPTTSLPPFRPFDVIAIFAVGVSGLPGRTKYALGGTAWTGDYLPGQRGPCQH